MHHASIVIAEFIKHVIEEGKFIENVKVMSELVGPDTYRHRAEHPSNEDTFWQDYFNDPSLDKKFFREISKVPKLHTNDVVAFLGAGSEGIAFRMDDGTVLKLGSVHTGIIPGGPNYLRSTPWKYKKKMEQHPAPENLRIHDVGRAHVSMEELVPFIDWVKQHTRNPGQIFVQFHDVEAAFKKFIKAGLRGADLSNSIINYANGKGFIISKIARAFANEVKSSSVDLNLLNLGVRENDDDFSFVFYDF